ncbi:MAG TPA: response regulator [Candidatus Dormibacteraeota bacterium]|jgi:CheY-like chemotaxis protein|nr:response regulator [Candidatus Dormibacteraeota bacterium]
MNEPALVLLVEDNLANQMLAVALLEREGYEVLLANNSTELFERLRTRRPDLILMDVGLPGHDGLFVTRQLKSNPDTAAIPIVAITAHAMAGDREQALAVGCDGYLSKPIDTRRFGSQIREFLGPASSKTRANGERDAG